MITSRAGSLSTVVAAMAVWCGCAGGAENAASASPETPAPPSGSAGGLPGEGGAAAPNMQAQAGAAAGIGSSAGSGPGAPPPAAGVDAGPAATDAGGAQPEQWTLLIEESWTLEPGGEVPQWCGDQVLDEDIYVTAIRPVHPPGTHHTTLSVTPTQTPCTTAALFQNGMIYAAGVGTEELRMPEGVAMKLPRGYVLHLGLHLYNVGDQELSGTSGIEVIRVDPEDVEHEAELMLSGPVTLQIPPGRHTVSHTCTVTQDQTLFALFPHMHQSGMHMKASVTAGGQSMLVHDAPYDFEEQYHLPLEPLALRAGDTITTECTYQNETAQTIRFGESSDTEMCFSIWFRYPATGNSFCGRSRR